MAKTRSAGNIKLASYEDLFGRDGTYETVTSVPISQLKPFKNHPFRVAEDEKMQETVESIKQYGVLVPGIVRPHPENGYEMIAGHRRRRACELAGLEEMPVIVRDLNDDESTIIMVDTNIQREDILPSEKAKAYKMKYDAMRHQGSRGDGHTADIIGEAAGDSGRTVQRYIRLTGLVQELLDYVDENKIPMAAGEKLSYLKKEEQEWVVGAVENSGLFPAKIQAEQMKACSEAGELTESRVYAVLVKSGNKKGNVTIPAKKLRSYFPDTYSREQAEEVIYRLLEEWRQKEGGKEDAGDLV